MSSERYVAALAIGWEPKEGISLATAGPVPETGDVDIIAVGHLNGQPFPIPTEPFPAEHLARWRGYSLDMHGWPAIDPTQPQEPVWRFFEDDGTPSPTLPALELDRIRVQAAGSDLFAELIALAIPGRRIRTGIFGWDRRRPPRIPPTDEIERAVRGLELLGLVRDLESARRGRPALRTSPPVAKLKLARDSAKLHDTEPWLEWEHIAARLGVPNKSRTLRRWYANGFGRDWRNS
ncbi:MAG: hypothetical protein M3O34_08350 [Chloroflexota bacterium]|nr:hypothetical protein [Chloroflexota bacterium]